MDNVTTVDMNRSQYTVNRDMKNGQFLDWLKQPRPQWSTVRWININGMSWDVIKAIAIEYGTTASMLITRLTTCAVH
ncbi:hypothetical protein BGZ75_002183 [Mortierella antarctica]|nr:hypothetical protein BGZ75_002183 [Mortierella antarctica]